MRGQMPQSLSNQSRNWQNLGVSAIILNVGCIAPHLFQGTPQTGLPESEETTEVQPRKDSLRIHRFSRPASVDTAKNYEHYYKTLDNVMQSKNRIKTLSDSRLCAHASHVDDENRDVMDNFHARLNLVRGGPRCADLSRSMETLEGYRTVLQKLFPNVELDSLTGLPRDKLLDMLNNSPQQQKQQQLQEPQPPVPVCASSFSGESSVGPADVDAESLEVLQTMPFEGPNPSEVTSSDSSTIADDVNALSFSVRQASTYLGISSVMAVWRVICCVAPEAETCFSQYEGLIGGGRRSGQHLNQHMTDPEQAFSDYHCEHLIDCYFSSFNKFVPLLDEKSFRETYTAKTRTDDRWLRLLNLVLAMGSIAASTADDHTHRRYFNRAKQYLNFDCLASANLETPNLASTFMGATLRLATALGLHRVYIHGRTDNAMEASFELRRRVWWSIVVLDSWASLALGRPSMGRLNDAITANLRHYLNIEESETIVILRENIRFCHITTQIEDALALCSTLEQSNLALLDASMVDWYLHLPLSIRLPTSSSDPNGPCTGDPRLTAVKLVMRWRYLSARIILHRPALLWYTMCRIPFHECPDDKKAAIVKCREIAKGTIHDIASTWTGHKASQVNGWNATWLLYQASMVPWLTLLSEGHDDDISDDCHQQIKEAMAALYDMRYYAPTAVRSWEVVSTIYELCKRRSGRSGVGMESLMVISNSSTSTSDAFDGTLAITSHEIKDCNTFLPEVTMDDMMESVLWGTNEYMLFADSPNSFGGWGFLEQNDEFWLQLSDSSPGDHWQRK
ncbi:putative C6 transcription factor [Lipomyces starkeyi]